MKKLFSIILIAFTFILNVKAAEVPSFVASAAENTFSINLSYWKAEFVDVRIIDNAGNVLVSEKLATNENRIRVYNLKNLIDGNYKVVVEDQTKVVTQDVTLFDNTVSTSTNVKNIYKPTSDFKDGVWKLNYLSLGKDVTVRIADASGEVLFAQYFDNAGTINKAFDLTKLKKGIYTAVVITEDEDYSFDLVK